MALTAVKTEADELAEDITRVTGYRAETYTIRDGIFFAGYGVKVEIPNAKPIYLWRELDGLHTVLNH